MRAVRVHEYGQPPSLDEIAHPDGPEGGQVAIDVTAVGVGAWDAGVVSGRLAEHVAVEPPIIIGAEFAGRVAAVGDGVDGFAVGDRVMGNPGIVGAWAERIVVDAERCGHAPTTLDDAQAAAIPVGGLTARQALDLLALPGSASLLVLGAGGDVGRAAIQLARTRVSTVIALARGHETDRSRELGADLAVRDDEDWPDAIGSALAGGVDGVLDLIGGVELERAIDLVRPGGRIVTTRSEEADTPVPDGVTLEFVPMRARTADLDALAADVDAGELSLPADHVLSLDDAPTLLGSDDDERPAGKIVLAL